MQTTNVITIADAARAAVLAEKIDGSKTLTGTQFRACYARAVSALGLTKGSDVEGLAPAIRAEHKALVLARNTAVLSGMEQGVAGKTRFILTADGSSARVSVPYSRAGTDAETIEAAKAVLAKVLDEKASEGTRTQHAARCRHATATLCRLDADFAIADAKRRIAAAKAAATALVKAAADKAAAKIAAAAGQPVTKQQIAKAKALKLQQQQPA